MKVIISTPSSSDVVWGLYRRHCGVSEVEKQAVPSQLESEAVHMNVVHALMQILNRND